MAQRFHIHPTHPQPRLIQQASKILQGGGLAVIPTDACYAFCCHLNDKDAAQRLRAIRGIDDKHLLTILCADLSQLANYALVDNRQYRFLRTWTPGPYTFVLQATKDVPKRLAHPSRRTIGLRVPNTPIVNALLMELGEPVLASTLKLPGSDEPLHDPDEIESILGKRIDLLIDAGGLGSEPSTIVEMTADAPLVTRLALGGTAISLALQSS